VVVVVRTVLMMKDEEERDESGKMEVGYMVCLSSLFDISFQFPGRSIPSSDAYMDLP
jgi:hypothetical protein